MTPEILKERFLAFAVETVGCCGRLRVRPEARHIADQLTASGTSAAVNYRAACRARSHREFIAKLSIALEEADESLAWLVILRRTGLATTPVLEDEAGQLVAILEASRRTARRRAKEARPR